MHKVINSFRLLKEYCENEGFKGWDPYDGLNSKVFQALPFLKKSAICRLVVIQGFKRCPVNLRRLALVPKEYNAKGIGLFLSGYCNLYNAVKANPKLAESLGSPDSLKSRINELAELLISLQSKGYSREKRFLEIALSAAHFVINDLHRTEYKDGFLFSYSPLQGNDTVFNASLLGSRLLSFCYKYTGNEEYCELAEQSIKACCSGQKPNGAWVYGMLPVQSWVDSFHTGYNLDALIAYQELTGDNKYRKYIEKGFEYYIQNFFEANGMPKYYDNRTYPIDIHCPGQLLVTLARLHKIEEYKEIAEKVIDWTIRNMQDRKGYFYYQLKPGISSKISYMRWSNAFIFNAMSHYLLAE